MEQREPRKSVFSELSVAVLWAACQDTCAPTQEPEPEPIFITGSGRSGSVLPGQLRAEKSRAQSDFPLPIDKGHWFNPSRAPHGKLPGNRRLSQFTAQAFSDRAFWHFVNKSDLFGDLVSR